MRDRGRFEGVRKILAFNSAFYLVGLFGVVEMAIMLAVLKLPIWISAPAWIGTGLGLWWLLASIVASYWVYDASRLMKWDWLDLPKPDRWINLHAGLDESSPQLTDLWGAPEGVYDFFDSDEMTEKSILRARQMVQNEAPATATDYRSLPIAGLDLATVIFAAHELRSPGAKEAFFREIARALSTGGKLVVVEHLRDVPNFIVFGPGFMHFFPAAEWRRVARAAGFERVSEKRLTPFVKAFVWERA